MSVFKSAIGYFSSGGANGSNENDFVGQFVEIGNMKLRVKKVIAEGEFLIMIVPFRICMTCDQLFLLL